MKRNDRDFFNSLAASWDQTRSHNPALLASLVRNMHIRQKQRVLDVGCGTGVLIPFLLKAVGHIGKVVGIDIADQMVELAAKKFQHLTNVELFRLDVMDYMAEDQFDHVTCLNFFPHIQNQSAFLKKALDEWLLPGGWLHVCHDLSRTQVNAIHGGSEVVKEDRLPACEVIGRMFEVAGFTEVHCFEDETSYFVQGRKQARKTFK